MTAFTILSRLKSALFVAMIHDVFRHDLILTMLYQSSPFTMSASVAEFKVRDLRVDQQTGSFSAGSCAPLLYTVSRSRCRAHSGACVHCSLEDKRTTCDAF
eukprot:IDg10996t1